MTVERTDEKHHGGLDAVSILQGGKELRHFGGPCLELVIAAARIGGSPRHGDESAPTEMLHHIAADISKRQSVGIGLLSALDAAQLVAVHGGTVGTDALQVAAVGVGLPAHALQRAILLPHHDATVDIRAGDWS